MPRQKDDQGEGFARPFWDMVRDIESEYKVFVEVRLFATGRRGVFEVQLLATRLEDPPTARPMALAAQDWPNDRVQSLPALLYNLSYKLGRCVEETRIDDGLAGRLW